ncbi:MAG: Hsp70 family protein, partial [Acidimicrobiales bacterium]
MSYQLGVDLGTTYTAAAISRDGRTEMVTLGVRLQQMPSVVVIREDGEFIVGEAAERRALIEPDRVAREFKRRLGDT